MKEENVRLHVLLRGRVQGVGLRFYAERRAGGLGLTGWTRNLYDGGVELTAEGRRTQLEVFLDYLKAGPGSAMIETAEVDWSAGTGEFPDFRVTSSSGR